MSPTRPGRYIVRELIHHPGPPLGTRWIRLHPDSCCIHGTDEPWTIGFAATPGCIRMYNKDVEFVFTVSRAGPPSSSSKLQIRAAPRPARRNRVIRRGKFGCNACPDQARLFHRASASAVASDTLLTHNVFRHRFLSISHAERGRCKMAVTMGKIRGMQQLSTEEGIFTILACDQRGAMERMMRAAGRTVTTPPSCR